jgi:hypothetical protein
MSRSEPKLWHAEGRREEAAALARDWEWAMKIVDGRPKLDI